MDDLLKQSAAAYEALMPYRYSFVLGHKGKEYELNIDFPSEAYHHLAGFHKAGFASLKNKNKALDVILVGDVSASDFAAAGIDLTDRWRGIIRLREMLEANEAVFRWRGHERADSDIKADYLLSDEQTNFFVAADHPASIFGQKGQRYEINCPRMKTLCIKKEHIETGQIEEIFRASSYRETSAPC